MTTKVCASCKVEKDASAFKRSNRNTDGLYSYCRVCAAEKERTRRAPIREKIRAKDKAYYEGHKDEAGERFKKRMEDPEKRARKAETEAAWMAARPDKTAEYSARHYAKNAKNRNAQTRAYYADHREQERARMLEYQQRNLHLYAANAAKRRAAERRATPAWLTDDDRTMMQITYQMAGLMSERLGVKFHVDHIHPINGDTVCGLHVPTNLRVITEAENIAKGNTFVDHGSWSWMMVQGGDTFCD